MKVMILMKLGEDYKLYSHDSCIATTQESPHKRLSKENCDEIFGVVDVDKLAKEYAKKADDISAKYSGKVFGDNNSTPFKNGFNKAMELNKDKLFTEQQVRTAIEIAWRNEDSNKIDIIKTIQQPTEIEVEIEMICHHPSDTYKCGLEFGCDEDGCNNPNQIPYLDKNGCLILKKK